jgi:hypothetical protein
MAEFDIATQQTTYAAQLQQYMPGDIMGAVQAMELR